MLTLSYGPRPDQVGDLHLPEGSSLPLVCLFHGGFWRLPFGRDELTPVAQDLRGRGLAVWNLEYHRGGSGSRGWPTTVEDIDAIVSHLPSLEGVHPSIDLRRVAFVGHSAGGHLAFCAAARHRSPVVAIGLAPLVDLVAAHAQRLGDGAVEEFLGGSPASVPERFARASPRAMVPLGMRQILLHGDADTVVPVGMSQAYAAAARAAGDDATCVVLPRTGHMEFLDVRSVAHETLVRTLTDLIGRQRPV